MVSSILKLKNFVRKIGKDLQAEELLKLTHLQASASTESIMSSVEDKNNKRPPLMDYKQLNHQLVPTLETHVRLKHEANKEQNLVCPWCNREYFDWLVQHGMVGFINEIDHEHYTIPVDVEEPGQPLNPAAGLKPLSPFKFFHERTFTNKQGRTREYHRQSKVSKWMKDSLRHLETIKEKSVVEVASYTEHNQFAKLPKSQDTARAWITDNCLYNFDNLDPLPIDDNLFVLPNSEYMRGADFPKYLVMRFDKAIPKNVCDQIWKKWVDLRKVLNRFERSKNSRDKEPQAHFGMWRHYRSFVYLISDTINQTPRALKLIKEFLTLLRDHVVPRMWSLLRRYDPNMFERHVAVREQMALDDKFMDTMHNYDHVDFGGMFYAMAVKDGGSQKIHLDWMDHQGTYAWIINVGPGWEGGDLCLPQLGKRLPTRPGQIVAFQGRYLAHCTAPTIGDRLAITCFTDRSLMGQALKLAKPSESPPTKNKRRRNPETSRKRAKRGRKDDTPA